jgi:outer membrane immunogenic protein
VKKLILAGVAAAALAGPAFAADMAPPPMMRAAPEIVPVYDWGGLYIGGVIGGAWGSTDTSDPGLGLVGTLLNVPVIQTTDASGFIGGIEGGGRYQMGKLVS